MKKINETFQFHIICDHAISICFFISLVSSAFHLFLLYFYSVLFRYRLVLLGV